MNIALHFYCLIIVLTFFRPGSTLAQDNNHLYATGNILEIDRCASAWLIQRFVDPQASILLLGDDELRHTKAIQFDTPASELRRNHRASTFEVIREEFGLQEAKLKTISLIIHDLEINFWNKVRTQATQRFAEELHSRLEKAPDNKAALDSCYEYLDNFFASTKQQGESIL